MAAKDGTVPDLTRHYARLAAGAALLRLAVPISTADLAAAILELLAENALTTAALRLTLTREPGPRSVLPPGQLAPTLLLNLTFSVPDQPHWTASCRG